MDSCIDFDWTTSGTDDTPDGNINETDFGTAFNTHIPFTCCDIGVGPLMIELQIVDASGNTARCMVEVTVQDKSTPEIICPPDMRISCGTLIDSVALYDISDRTFGTVLNGLIYDDTDRQPVIFDGEDWGVDGIAFDNCNLELGLEVEDLRDVCGAGEIRRTFTATDPANGSTSCTQVILVSIADPLSREDIEWPEDTEVEGTCGMDPIISGQPVIAHVSCDLMAFQYKDLITGPVDGACAKILRTWYVIDWCQYDLVTGEGLWEQVQTIKVLNSAGPEFMNACASVTLCQDDPALEETSPCTATVTRSQIVTDDCTPPAKLKWQYALDVYGDGAFEYTSPLQTGAGPNAMIVGSSLHLAAILPDLPFNDPDDSEAHHVIRWMVRDDCGNDRSCAESIRISDCKAPTPVCQALIQPLAPDGTAEIWASDFNASSSDNCTPAEDLRYSFSAIEIVPSMSFDCDDIAQNGSLQFDLPIWVWDAWDNVASCVATLTLQDPMQICDEVPNLTISGHIQTAFGEPVELVYTALEGGMSAEYMTSGDGDYHFAHVPMMQQYEIIPSRNDDPKNGVTTLDLILIQKHLLGLQAFTEPYEFIAADINRSENVSALDLIELRKLILGIYSEFPNNTSWRFMDAQTTFADPDHPFDFTESIVIGALTDHAPNRDFTAVKIGDLNGTVQANASQIITRSGIRQWSLEGRDQLVQAGEEIELTFNLHGLDQVLGFQGFIELHGLQFMAVSGALMDVTEEHVAVFPDGLALSWSRGNASATTGTERQVFTFKLTALKDGRLSEMLHLSPGRMAPEIYGTDQNGNIETQRLGLIFTEEKHSDKGLPFALYQNVPNPWQHETLIKFDLPAAMEYTLTVYDVMGRARQTKSGLGTAGSNYVMITSEDLRRGDVLYYNLVAREYAAVKKMILSQ
jgi:hypothetical protein